jgi:hypothetical protein
MKDLKTRYQYLNGGFSWANPQTGQNIQQGAGVVGSFVSQLTAGDEPSVTGGAVSGALSGAATGAAFGPIGAAGGAIIGGIMGGVNAKKKADELEEQKRKIYKAQEEEARRSSQVVLQDYPTKGVEVSGYYAKYGGQIPSFLTSALAEGGEVAVSNSLPQTDQNGSMNPLASNVSKFEGDSHSDPSGGIGFNNTSDAFIFSDSLRTQEGLTFAKEAELIGKKKGKFENKLKTATDHAAHNTAQRMIQKFDNKLAQLFNEQEALKNENI